jgi:uncharacterized protein
LALVSGGRVLNVYPQGVQMPMPDTAWFALASMAGVLLGRWAVQRLRVEKVRRVFAVLLIAVALNFAYKTVHHFV